MARQGNPFTPTFGHVPYALAGRSELIDDVIGGLANRPGDPNRSTIFVGSRGTGKTVLLTAISREASGQGWVCANVSAQDGILRELICQIREKAAHIIGEDSGSDITSITAGPLSVTREIKGEEPTFRSRITELVAKLNERGVGLLITVDEINPKCAELARLITAYQHLVSEERDVALLMAGLPANVSMLLADESISFIRRAFQRPLGPIESFEVEQALLDTIESNGRSIEPDALAFAAQGTGGFAFAIQLIGYYLWRTVREEGAFEAADVKRAISAAQQEMERSVFIPTLRELRPREVDYLRAMAQDPGCSSTSEVARRMGVGMTNASNLRRRLIEHGIIAEVRMGSVEFAMPMLADYLRGISS